MERGSYVRGALARRGERAGTPASTRVQGAPGVRRGPSGRPSRQKSRRTQERRQGRQLSRFAQDTVSRSQFRV